MKKQIITSLFLILIIISGRLMLHHPNFTPAIAASLFAGVYLRKEFVPFIALVALFLSDIALGFHDTMIFVYSSLLIASFIGIWAGKKKSFKKIIFSTLASALVFFTVTNFGVWIQGHLYPQTLPGLFKSYYMAIPFFRNSLLGSLFYAFLLFGGYEKVLNYAKKWKFAQRLSK